MFENITLILSLSCLKSFSGLPLQESTQRQLLTMASRAPHALNHTSSPISFSYFVPLAHRALAMLACHRVLVPAMLSAWNALLQLFIHTADFTSQLQYPQALGHLKNSLALCPDAHYNLSLLYFSLRHLPLSQITSLCTCYNRMKAP